MTPFTDTFTCINDTFYCTKINAISNDFIGRKTGSFIQYIDGKPNMVKWLKHQACDQHSLSSKPTHAILLCPWERHFTCLVVLASSSKLQSYLY